MRFRRNLVPLLKAVSSARINWQTTVKGGRVLGAYLLRIVHLRRGGLTMGYVGIVFQYTKFVANLQRQGGWKYVVKYLKACSVLLQQAASGHKIHAAQSLGVAVSRTRAGIPRVIHSLSRKRIRGGSHWELRLWLSLLGLYRVIDIPGRLKLESITQGPSVTTLFLVEWVLWLSSFVRIFFNLVGHAEASRKWSQYIGRSPIKLGESVVLSGETLRDFVLELSATVFPPAWVGLPLELKPRFKLFTTSGPGSTAPKISTGVPPRMNTTSMITDCVMVNDDPKIGPACQQWLSLVGDDYLTDLTRRARIAWDCVIQYTDDMEGIGFEPDRDRTVYKDHSVPPSWRGLIGIGTQAYLGKLGFKTEPAGKIRVFAMLDSFTQMLMAPLHESIFGLMAKIPQDGTFEQHQPILRLLAQGHRKFWSLDLSSATDRFPLSLQQAVLGLIIGPRLASIWVTILDRVFMVPRFIPALKKGMKPVRVPKGTPKTVKYGTGQPMGALTSWAVFSLTHHFLVQFAAYKVSGKLEWFPDYALLGDDIVIANKKVAESYLDLLREIGVGCGLEKSLISSTGGIEFAKRTYFHGEDASGIPLVALGAANADEGILEEILERTGVRGFWEALSVASRVLGYGYRSRTRLPFVFEIRNRLQGLAILLSRPTGPFGFPIEDWLCLSYRGKNALLPKEGKRLLCEAMWQRLLNAFDVVYEDLVFMAKEWKWFTSGKPWHFDNKKGGGFIHRGGFPWVGFPVDELDYFSFRSKVAGPEYLDFVRVDMFTPYTSLVFKDIDEIKQKRAEMEALYEKEGDINGAYKILADMMEQITSVSRHIKLSYRTDKVKFGTKRRSATVKFWRAMHLIVQSNREY